MDYLIECVVKESGKMLDFDSLDELWMDTVNELLGNGEETSSRDGRSIEQVGFCARLLDPTANWLFNPVRAASPSYGAAELLWYLSETDSITMIQAYAPQYSRFAENNKAYGAYGKRWNHDELRNELFKCVTFGEATEFYQGDFFQPISPPTIDWVCPVNQLQLAVWLLKKKPDTRQCIVVHWTPGDLAHAFAGDKKDLPCTIFMQFLLRDNKLNMIVTMRSNDLWLGVPYDIWCFTCLQQLVAEALNVELGWYQHQAGSMHLYERNLEKAELVTKGGEYKIECLEFDPHKVKIREAIYEALQAEKFMRTRQQGYITNETPNKIGQGSLLSQCCLMAASKWRKQRQKDIKSKLMGELICDGK